MTHSTYADGLKVQQQVIAELNRKIDRYEAASPAASAPRATGKALSWRKLNRYFKREVSGVWTLLLLMVAIIVFLPKLLINLYRWLCRLRLDRAYKGNP